MIDYPGEGKADSPSLAGSDATETALRGTLLHIISSPRVTGALLAEIANVSPSSPIQNPEASKMSYLQAVIKEGLGILPPVTGLMSKVVPHDGDTVNGVFIAGGTKIGYCAWGLFPGKKILGDDASMFLPGRWIECPVDKVHEREAALELIFWVRSVAMSPEESGDDGVEQDICRGKSIDLGLGFDFADILNPQLLRRFDMSIIDPVKPWDPFNFGIFVQSIMWLRASKRSQIL